MDSRKRAWITGVAAVTFMGAVVWLILNVPADGLASPATMPVDAEASGRETRSPAVPPRVAETKLVNATAQPDRSPESITIRADLPPSDSKDWSEMQESSASVDVSVELAGCKGCWKSTNRAIRIAPECHYISHTLTQLRRLPYVPIDQSGNAITHFDDVVYRDTKGRIHAVGLELWIHTDQSAEAALSMTLTVVSRCPQP
jgi:hypothetical protein